MSHRKKIQFSSEIEIKRSTSKVKMKEVKVVVRDLRKEISEDLMKTYEKEFLEMKMREIKKEKGKEEVEEPKTKRIKLEAEEDFLFTYEKEPKMPKKEILRMEIQNSSQSCKTVTEHQCEICQKYFAHAVGLKRHWELHYKVPKLKQKQSFHCEKCNEVFASSHTLKVHLCFISMTCPHCNVTLKNKRYVKIHLRKIHGIEIDGDKFLCDYCGCGFTAIEYLKTHFKNGNCRKLKDPYSCDQCEKTFTHKHKLKMHVLVHSKYEVECNICGAKMGLGARSTHMRMHHPKTDENFQCKICSQFFKNSMILQRHLKVHNKKFQCTKCARKFATQGLLNFHMKIHDNPDQHRCKVCGKRCTTNQKLKIHMKVHEVDRKKDLECNRCDYKTDLMQSIKKHLKFHEKLDKKLKENPNAVKCEKCPSVALNLYTLRTHMRLKHGNQKKYQCALCQYSTIYKKDLIGHLSRMH